MAKQITLTTKDGREYTLKFTRNSIRRMEQRGFDPNKADTAPMTVAAELFEGAFYACHPTMKRDAIMDLFEEIGDLNEWMNDLSELYQDPYSAETEGEIKRAKNW